MLHFGHDWFAEGRDVDPRQRGGGRQRSSGAAFSVQTHRRGRNDFVLTVGPHAGKMLRSAYLLQVFEFSLVEVTRSHPKS